MKNIKILTATILIIFMASMVAFGAPVYVNVGPTTEFDGDIKILSEIVAEGTTADGWETTIFFTDPTADRTITIPDFDVTLGTAILLTVTDNENTNETNAVLFTSGGALAGGVLGIESDGDYYYNPSDGSVHATMFYGDGSNLTGVGAAAATALTFTAKEENTSAMVKGQPVYISGAVGAAFPTIGLTDCDDSTKIRIAGLAAEAITQNTTGLVRRAGLLVGVDTLGANAVNPNGEAWAAGDILYVDDTVGGLTNVKPTSGRIIKAAYTLYGSSNTDDLLVFPHENPVYIACAPGEDIDLRMGDEAGVNKVIFEDYADNEVAFIDSNGQADFNSLILDNPLLPAEGGTGVANAANNTITFTGNFTLGITLTANTAITLPTTGIVISDATACTDIEGTYLSIAAGVLNVSGLAVAGANTDITSILNVGLYVGRDLDNRISWATDDRLIIEIANVIHTFLDIETGTGDNDSLVTQGYVDDAVVGGGATTALDNLAAVQINTTLLSDTPDTDSLGTAAAEWLNLYVGDAGRIFIGLAQDLSIHRSGAGIMTLTAANGVVTSAGLTVGGTLAMAANNITTTGYIGRDVDNFLDWTIDNSLTIEIGGVQHDIVSISTGVGNNDKLCTQGYADDAAAGGGANVALSNLAGVAINLSLVSDTADTDDLGSATHEWLNLYLGTYGTVYFGTGQTESIAETAVNALLITATGGVSFSDEIITTNTVGRDNSTDYISWAVDNQLTIKINNVAHDIVSISTGIGDNDKLVTQGYVDDIVGGASLALDNLGAVQINTSLLSDTADTDDLGTAAAEWRSLYIGTVGKIYMGLSQEVALEVTDANTLYITATANVSISNGLIVSGTVALAANNLTMTGSIAATGARVTKIWTAALESTADITINGTALAAIYANLGANTDITSLTNAALIIGRDADNSISFITDDKIIFKTAGVANMEILSTGEVDFNAFSAVFTEQVLSSGTAIAWDLGNSNKATLTAAHNFTITITAPSGALNAQVIITQDGTGTRVMDEIVTQKDEAITAASEVHADTEIIDLSIDIPTGARIRFKTDSADPPAPLVVDTIYWAIRSSENHIQVATTKALAMAGTSIDLTDAGSGIHTVQQLVKWMSGTLGVLSTAIGSEDILSLTYKTADKQWYAQIANDFY